MLIIVPGRTLTDEDCDHRCHYTSDVGHTLEYDDDDHPYIAIKDELEHEITQVTQHRWTSTGQSASQTNERNNVSFQWIHWKTTV